MAEVSKEYAAALFMLACENNAKQEYADALELFGKTFTEEPAYLAFLSSPAIPLSERLEALRAAFAAYVPEDALSYLLLLCEKGRLSCFFDSVLEYGKLLAASENIKEANVVSAVPLSDKQKKTMIDELEKKYQCTVKPQYSVDASLLGGVVITIDGKVLDGSLRKNLRDVKDVIGQ